MTNDHPFKIKSLLILSLLLAVFGCNAPPNVTVQATAPAAVSPQDFSLEIVVGLLQSGVADAATLESKINDPSTGINNVDIDKDGRVDYIQIVEQMIPSGKKLELIAQPSSGTIPEMTIAAIKFDTTGQELVAEAGFAPLVDPAGVHYYRSNLAASLLFTQWLLMPSRPIFLVHPRPIGYSYYGRRSAPAFSQTRTTYSQQTRIAPIQAQPRPQSFNAGRLTSPPRSSPRPVATTVTGASQGVSNFGVDNRQKSAGTAFGAAPAPRAPSFSSPTPRPAAPAARPSPPASRPSPSPSRGRSR